MHHRRALLSHMPRMLQRPTSTAATPPARAIAASTALATSPLHTAFAATTLATVAGTAAITDTTLASVAAFARAIPTPTPFSQNSASITGTAAPQAR
jgi:hypothetical protein